MLTTAKKDKILAYWLFLGVFLIIVQTLLGGITRLSGSGLSITEWDIVTGVIPPLNHQQWLAEFAKYKASPQFQYLNFDFTLSDFKSIFFWEWFHRFWARMMGLIFAIPFIYFLIKGYFKKSMIYPLIILFILGALQGLVGWIMVQSGLVGDATFVRPTRLAIHFVLAMVLACYVLWMALNLWYNNSFRIENKNLLIGYGIILVLVLFQFIYGALLAGHKAATVASTWPTINGDWIPENLMSDQYGHPLINNKITIHFIHRTNAYLILIVTLIVSFYAFSLKDVSNAFKKWRLLPINLVFLQVTLGVLSLLFSKDIQQNVWGSFETFALLHQLVGMLMLLSTLAMMNLLNKKEE